MQKAAGVSRRQTGGDLAADPHGFLDAQPTFADEVILEGLAVEQFQCDERRVAVHPDLVDGHHVFVPECGGALRLTQKAVGVPCRNHRMH